MRFAIAPNHRRIADLVRALDADESTFAETWRRVGEAAERLGERRPSYGHVRRLAHVERTRRALRAQAAALLIGAGSTFAAGRVPPMASIVVRLRELREAEELVLQEHKAFFGSGDV
jgi:hypothetical protein